MTRLIHFVTLATAGMLAGTAIAQTDDPAEPTEPTSPSCHVGVYRLANGRHVDIAPQGEALRWRMLDGDVGLLRGDAEGGWTSTQGWTFNPDGRRVSFGTCAEGRISFAGVTGQIMRFDVQDVRFDSGGTMLAGRLVMPDGTGKVPVMVVGHGSERTSARAMVFRQRLYPAQGVGVFVFDKRGTGASGGKYTQDFNVLSNDVVAALVEARRLAGVRAGRIGLQGGSQAGWVLPLAATRAKVDFVIVGYGIAASPATEDRNETLQDLAAAGWGTDVLAKAAEVTDATAGVVGSRFTAGYERFNAIVAKYRDEPWFKDLNGEYTGEVVKYSEAQLRVGGPARDDGTPWNHDARGVLAQLRTPLLWMVAGQDTEGPGPETPAALLELKGAGQPFTIVRFPNAEHGIHDIRVSAAGKREEIGYGRGYFAMELDFTRHGRLTRGYPGVEVLRPKLRSR